MKHDETWYRTAEIWGETYSTGIGCTQSAPNKQRERVSERRRVSKSKSEWNERSPNALERKLNTNTTEHSSATAMALSSRLFSKSKLVCLFSSLCPIPIRYHFWFSCSNLQCRDLHTQLLFIYFFQAISPSDCISHYLKQQNYHFSSTRFRGLKWIHLLIPFGQLGYYSFIPSRLGAIAFCTCVHLQLVNALCLWPWSLLFTTHIELHII